MSELKRLQKLESELETKIKKLKLQQAHFNRQITPLVDQLKELRAKLKHKKPDTIKVSDHAIVRYLERVEHINMDDIKLQIVNPDNQKAINVLGDGIYPLKKHSHIRIVVQDNTVVTVK